VKRRLYLDVGANLEMRAYKGFEIGRSRDRGERKL
jgi:hypothetical protein